MHSACCGPNTWNCAAGSPTVFVNGLPVVRVGDATTHCGGGGNMVQGSPNVFIGGESGTTLVARQSSQRFPSMGDSLFLPSDLPPNPPAVEYTHLQVSDIIKNNPELHAELKQIFMDSFLDGTPNGRIVEQGGWLMKRDDGTYYIERIPPGTTRTISFYPPRYEAVATVHSHPNGFHESSGFPSDDDIRDVVNPLNNKPGVIVFSPDGRRITTTVFDNAKIFGN